MPSVFLKFKRGTDTPVIIPPISNTTTRAERSIVIDSLNLQADIDKSWREEFSGYNIFYAGYYRYYWQLTIFKKENAQIKIQTFEPEVLEFQSKGNLTELKSFLEDQLKHRKQEMISEKEFLINQHNAFVV